MKLSVENITKSYSTKIAVNDISFEMDSGNILGLLGPNGAGKTTLFYMIAGLLKKDFGSIKLDSKDVSDKGISERSKLGLSYLPQEASIFRKLTVKECFNFQGFNKIQFPKDVPNTQLYKQAGNSVTVPLIKNIALNIKSSIMSSFFLNNMLER